jgi:hypothetical protein
MVRPSSGVLFMCLHARDGGSGLTPKKKKKKKHKRKNNGKKSTGKHYCHIRIGTRGDGRVVLEG